MKTLLIGATGATGSDLLKLLLDDDEVESVDIFVRRNTGVEHPKLTVHVINFEKPEEWSHLVKGDVLFSCLGTTRKDARSEEHTSELQSRPHLVCRLLLEKKKKKRKIIIKHK